MLKCEQEKEFNKEEYVARPKRKRGIVNEYEAKILAMQNILAIDAKSIHEKRDIALIEELSEDIDRNFDIIAPKLKLKFSDINPIFRSTALLILQRSVRAGLLTDPVIPVIDEQAYEETLEEWCYNPKPLELEHDNFMPLRL